MPPPPPIPTLYYGSYVHSLTLDDLEYTLDALIYIPSSGKIEWIEKDVPKELVQEVAGKHGLILGDGNEVELVELGEDEFLCPGFVDTHTHAPQYPNLGLGQEYQLLDWLQNVTFPREAMYSDVTYARKVYEQVVRRTLAVGVTTSSYYATLHEEGTKVLADVIHENGQRALVGKCNMDRDSPDFYREPSAAHSIEATKALVSHIRSLPHADPASPLVYPCITPRFAISCTSELMSQLGDLVTSDPSLHIQTHLSENTAEIKYTLELFPQCQTYTGVYDSYGMLRKGTILAHCVWLSEEEMKVISVKGAGISHCPNSNFNLMSGGARVGAMLDAGIEVSLGSDCGGGFSLGILSQIRDASKLSKILALNPSDKCHSSHTTRYTDKPLTIPMLFYMATLGGASVCNLKAVTGNFLPGKEFDAIKVSPGGSPNFFFEIGEAKREKSKEERMKDLRKNFERFLFVSDDRDIADVWVRGRRVAGSRL